MLRIVGTLGAFALAAVVPASAKVPLSAPAEPAPAAPRDAIKHMKMTMDKAADMMNTAATTVRNAAKAATDLQHMVFAEEMQAAEQRMQAADKVAWSRRSQLPAADMADEVGMHATMQAGRVVARAGANATACDADCSGHGTCQADATCVCADAWIGALCDTRRCPDDCNSAGICVSTECVCNQATFGLSCQHQRCPDDCKGQGYCFGGLCQCRQGYSGDNCGVMNPVGQTAAVNMLTLPANQAPPPINVARELSTLFVQPAQKCPSDCNARGECNAGTCKCWPGYSGASCQDFCPNECSHQGDCIEGACLCFAGFLGVDCSMKGCCSGHGTCDDPGECVCDAGWSGQDCSIMLMCPDPACSGHGKCKSGVCHCDAGFGGPTCLGPVGACNPPCGPSGFCNPGTKKCECQAGFTGPACLSQVQGCPSDCSDHGLCFNGACMCGPGWQGKDCADPFKATNAAGIVPGDKGGAGDDDDDDDLLGGAGGGDGAGGGGGDGGAGGGGAGPPAPGPAGPAPAAGGPAGPAGGPRPPIPVKCVDDCSGHGFCTMITPNAPGQCQCDAAYGGDNCGRPRLDSQMRKCANDCMGNGLCMDGKCVCNVGFNGVDCGMAVCADEDKIGPACQMPRCLQDCSAQGLCMNGKCSCWDGFLGADCSIPIHCYEPCHAACQADTRSEKCLHCVGQCAAFS